MAEGLSNIRVPMQLSRGCIVASIQVDFSDDVLEQFRVDLLDRVQSADASAVILDVSGIAVLDLDEFQALRDTMAMASLMGAKTIFAGFQPGVVSALVDLDAVTDDIEAAYNLDAAFALLEPSEPPAVEPNEEALADQDDTEVEPDGP